MENLLSVEILKLFNKTTFLSSLEIESLSLRTLASKLLIVVALFQIFDGIQIVAQGALRGIQDVKIPSIICFLSYVVFGVPIMIYLGLYTELKATGVWIGFLIGLLIASILLSVRFFKKCNIEIKR